MPQGLWAEARAVGRTAAAVRALRRRVSDQARRPAILLAIVCRRGDRAPDHVRELRRERPPTRRTLATTLRELQSARGCEPVTLPRWSLVTHIADAAGHVVCFASDREALLLAHPEYKALILAEVDICERARPVWLAVMNDEEENVIVGTNVDQRGTAMVARAARGPGEREVSMRSWYRFNVQATAAPEEVEILVYGDIGRSWWDDEAVEAKQFVEDLQALPDTVRAIRVRVNSVGGDVFEAVAIANALREQRTSKGRRVDVVIDGIAASAASIVIMAGETIQIAGNALVMIHNPFTLVIGNADELRKTADDLETVRAVIIATYRWHSPLSETELGTLMDAETWFDADAAVKHGFATEKITAPADDQATDAKVVATLNRRALAQLKHAPEPFRARVAAFVKPAAAAPAPPPAPTPPPAPVHAAAAADVLRLCREGECLDVAEALITVGATLEAVQARVGEERQKRTAALQRATEIRGLCSMARLPELAEGYIAGAMPLAAIRAHLTTLTAKFDNVEIDGTLDPPGAARRSALMPTANEIYQARADQADESRRARESDWSTRS